MYPNDVLTWEIRWFFRLFQWTFQYIASACHFRAFCLCLISCLAVRLALIRHVSSDSALFFFRLFAILIDARKSPVEKYFYGKCFAFNNKLIKCDARWVYKESIKHGALPVCIAQCLETGNLCAICNEIKYTTRDEGEESETIYFSLKLANKLKTEFKRKVQAHNKKQNAILNSIFLGKLRWRWRRMSGHEKN